MKKYNILVIDDNISFLNSVEVALSNQIVIKTKSIVEAKSILECNIDLILLDLVFDESNPDELEGMNFIPFIHINYPDIPIIVMTNYSSTSVTVEAIKAGATDFLSKRELDWTEWKIRIMNYCSSSEKIRILKNKNIELQKYDESEMIGTSEQIDFVRKRLIDLAINSEEIPILITGETGTGKNLAVKYYRKHSIRKEAPYKEFSISEISETVLESELFGHVKGAFTGAEKDKKGMFEEADGGILFLDEIGDYELKIQKKIMRFIEDKTITPVGSTKSKKLDIQLVMATNQNITSLIKEVKFREDLYQRINRISIELPPLRERKEDIRILIDYFFNHFKEKEKTNLNGIEEIVYRVLKEYAWPGNIRELQSVIWDGCTRARLDHDKILRIKHIRNEISIKYGALKEKLNGKIPIELKKAMIELEEIEETLRKTNGNKSKTAELLGMNLDSLRYKIVKLAKNNKDMITKFKLISVSYKL